MPENERPWGRYDILFTDAGAQVKRIEVKPGMRFSLQKHLKRAEHWVMVSGTGVVTLGQKELSAKRGAIFQVAVGELHRMHNTGAEPLVFIEVQLGDYLGEDDIIRLADDFKRI